MAGSMKDALEKSGRTEKTPEAPKQDQKKWLSELPAPEESAPYVPFEAPAILKTKPPPGKKR